VTNWHQSLVPGTIAALGSAFISVHKRSPSAPQERSSAGTATGRANRAPSGTNAVQTPSNPRAHAVATGFARGLHGVCTGFGRAQSGERSAVTQFESFLLSLSRQHTALSSSTLQGRWSQAGCATSQERRATALVPSHLLASLRLCVKHRLTIRVNPSNPWSTSPTFRI
jgi:hypothetical protein